MSSSAITAVPSGSRFELVYRLSQAFNSSLDLDEILNKVIDEVLIAVRAERGFVMCKHVDGSLAFKVARGMDQTIIDKPEFQISRGIVEQVKADGKAILTMDARQDQRFIHSESIVVLGLRSIICVPLKVKDTVTGIIYVDNRLKSGVFTDTDLELVSAIASSAAIAIENADLFQGIQQSKRDLEVAYEKTLEGWAIALEMRDHDTEGHSRRVTRMTEALARTFGLPEAELVHIRRGALLHDVGKMGIPDAILLKRGPLTVEEFAVMKQHPALACTMLQRIDFLQPAIPIPYCHHEKWDGSGYPQNLAGEAIPLAARLFAVIDVWDALCYDRPYRKALPAEQAADYLAQQIGKHFDPQIVPVFLEKIAKERYD